MAPWLWSRVISVISVAFSKSSQEIGMLWGKYYALPSALMKNALSWESSRTFARQYLQLIILTCGSSCGHCNIKIGARITFWTMCQSCREPSCLTCICRQCSSSLSCVHPPAEIDVSKMRANGNKWKSMRINENQWKFNVSAECFLNTLPTTVFSLAMRISCHLDPDNLCVTSVYHFSTFWSLSEFFGPFL